MNQKNNQNFIYVTDKLELEDILKNALGFANTFGGYLILSQKIDQTFIDNLKKEFTRIKIEYEYETKDGYNYFLIDISPELKKDKKGNYYFKDGSKLIEGRGNLIGINLEIYNVIKHTDLLRTEPYILQVFQHFLNQNSKDMEFKTYLIKTKQKRATLNLLQTDDLNIRYKSAKGLICQLWDSHEKKEVFLDLLGYLENFEKASQFIYKSQRDHVIHQAYVYLLGLYICSLIKKGEWVDNDTTKDIWYRLSWRLAATLHDIAYPFEIVSKSLNDFLINFNKKVGYTPRNLFACDIDKEFIDGKLEATGKSIEMHIANNVNYNPLELFKNYAKNGTPYCQNFAFFDHGILSGILFMRLIDKFYKDHQGRGGFEIRNIEKELSIAATAIIVHNLRWKNKKDKANRIKISNHIPFLLILSDMIQEWDRESSKGIRLPTTGIKLKYNEKKKRLYVKMAYDKEKIKKLNEEINEKLDLTGDLDVKFISF